jgi:DNA-binding NarL/FixJ family response regulator
MSRPAGYYGTGKLTERELETAKLIGRAWTNERIAEEMGITPHAVARFTGNIYGKLGLELGGGLDRRVMLAVWTRYQAWEAAALLGEAAVRAATIAELQEQGNEEN